MIRAPEAEQSGRGTREGVAPKPPSGEAEGGAVVGLGRSVLTLRIRVRALRGRTNLQNAGVARSKPYVLVRVRILRAF